MPAREASCSSMHTIECEEFSAVGSASSGQSPLAQGIKQPRNRHTPVISWSDLSQVDLKATSPASPKPLQILPTHLSIPDAYLSQPDVPTVEPGNLISSTGALASLPSSTRDDCNTIDIASIALPSAAMEVAAATQEPLEVQPGASASGEETSKESVIVHQDSGIVHQDSVIVHQDSVIVHQDNVIVHQDSLIPDAPEGGAVAEGNEQDRDSTSATPARTSGVSFGPEPKRNLHRHKSSNYSRLLDFRLDDWCGTDTVGFLCLDQDISS